MQEVLSRGKDFEFIVLSNDPVFAQMVDAIKIVKQFIIDRKLILYGGTAIDMALRLKGASIYPDSSLLVPDLDFFSPNSIEDSYALADILYEAGYKEARAIRALHAITQKVDLVSNHFIADITFCPKAVFDKIPFIMYDQFRVIHPDFQKVDMHSALSFPYDDPPIEVIFNRLTKDIKRYNILEKYYPVETGGGLQLRPVRVPIGLTKYVLNGFAAYALIHKHWREEHSGGTEASDSVTPDVVDPHFAIADGEIVFDTFDGVFEIVHLNPAKAVEELGMVARSYAPYINLRPETHVGKVSGLNMRIDSTKNRLLATNVVRIEGKYEPRDVRVVNIQYLMKHFMAEAQMSEGKLRGTYLTHYQSLQVMARSVRGVEPSPLFLSIETYGGTNYSTAYEILIGQVLHDIEGFDQLVLPWNYYPARSIPKGMAHPAFDPESCKFFCADGREQAEGALKGANAIQRVVDIRAGDLKLNF